MERGCPHVERNRMMALLSMSPQSGTNSPFSGPWFVLALAGRPVSPETGGVWNESSQLTRTINPPPPEGWRVFRAPSLLVTG